MLQRLFVKATLVYLIFLSQQICSLLDKARKKKILKKKTTLNFGVFTNKEGQTIWLYLALSLSRPLFEYTEPKCYSPCSLFLFFSFSL